MRLHVFFVEIAIVEVRRRGGSGQTFRAGKKHLITKKVFTMACCDEIGCQVFGSIAGGMLCR